MSEKTDNKIPNVPNIRFNDNEWNYSKLGDICSGFDYGLGAEAIPYDGENVYIRITDINEETSNFDKSNIVSPSYIDESCLVNENDILFARTGASTGKTCLYKKSDGKIYFAGFLIRANVNDCFNAYFIFQQTKTTKYNNWVKMMSARSGQPGINAKEYKLFKISYPDTDTQNKIALFLSKIDARIETQSKIIEDLEVQKKYIINSFFSKINMIGAPLNFEKIFKMYKEINENNYQQYTIGKNGIRCLYNDNQLYSTNSHIVFKPNTLILGVGIEEIGVSTNILGCCSPIYKTYHINNELIKTKFLDYFAVPYFNMYKRFITQKSTRRDFEFDYNQLYKIRFCIPTIDFQNKTILFLDKLCKKIEKEKDILSLYKKQKAYLLQNMFI